LKLTFSDWGLILIMSQTLGERDQRDLTVVSKKERKLSGCS